MLHENLNRDHSIKASSERTFGLVFAAFALAIGAAPVLRKEAPHLILLALSGAFLLVAIFWPLRLRPLNQLWTKFGLILGRIVSPISLGLLFFGVITPLAVMLRWMGRDVLQLKLDPRASSYWIPRGASDSETNSMTLPF